MRPPGAHARRHALAPPLRGFATAGLALLLLAATGLETTARAQTDTAFVSNIGQDRLESYTISTPVAVAFGTGAQSDGYVLSGVDVVSGGGQNFSTWVCTVDADRLPTQICTPLQPPASFGAGTVSFTASPTIVLRPNTGYAAVFEPSGRTGTVFSTTTRNSEDQGTVDGWSLDDGYLYYNTSTMRWREVVRRPTPVLRVAIEGSENTPPTDARAPALDADTAISLNGETLVLTYDEDLDVFSSPAPDAFTIQVGDAQRSVSRVVLSGRTVTLTLSSAASHGETVTLSYAVPGSDPIQDVAGNDAVALTDEAVTNETPLFVTGVAVTSEPRSAADTYGAGEDIEFTIAFSGEVEVSASRPHFEFNLGTGNVRRAQAQYVSGSGTTALVFAYTVQPADRDSNGIRVGSPEAYLIFDSGEYVRSVANGTDAALAAVAPGLQFDHKVDGRLTPPDTTAPVLHTASVDGAALALTYDEALDEASVPAPGAFTVTVAGTVRALAASDPVAVSRKDRDADAGLGGRAR